MAVRATEATMTSSAIECDEEDMTAAARTIVESIRCQGGLFLQELRGSRVAWDILSDSDAIQKTTDKLIEKQTNGALIPNGSDSETNSGTDLGPNDVVIGRGFRFHDHVGNEKYKQLVESCLERYRTSGGPSTAKYIIGIIHERGGRFFGYVSDQEVKLIPREMVIQKVISALAYQKLKKRREAQPWIVKGPNHLTPAPPTRLSRPSPPPPLPPSHFHPSHYRYNYQAQPQPYYFPPTYPHGYGPL